MVMEKIKKLNKINFSVKLKNSLIRQFFSSDIPMTKESEKNPKEMAPLSKCSVVSVS